MLRHGRPTVGDRRLAAIRAEARGSPIPAPRAAGGGPITVEFQLRLTAVANALSSRTPVTSRATSARIVRMAFSIAWATGGRWCD